MKQIYVVYWSGTGNTEAMALAVAEGAQATLVSAENFTPEMAAACDAAALGCPAMGAEVLEEEVFQPMYDACKSALAGKPVALFGSYGWGDGEWMRAWADDCAAAGVTLAAEPLICCEAPDDDVLDACRALGAALC